jgi:hypothetical protein
MVSPRCHPSECCGRDAALGSYQLRKGFMLWKSWQGRAVRSSALFKTGTRAACPYPTTHVQRSDFLWDLVSYQRPPAFRLWPWPGGRSVPAVMSGGKRVNRSSADAERRWPQGKRPFSLIFRGPFATGHWCHFRVHRPEKRQTWSAVRLLAVDDGPCH